MVSIAINHQTRFRPDSGLPSWPVTHPFPLTFFPPLPCYHSPICSPAISRLRALQAERARSAGPATSEANPRSIHKMDRTDQHLS